MKNYQEPKVNSENITIVEPVETGCCLRSCGGSPGRMGREEFISEETDKLFEKLQENK